MLNDTPTAATPLKPPAQNMSNKAPSPPAADARNSVAQQVATQVPLKPPLRTTKRAAALNAIPAIVTADVWDFDDSPMHCLADSPPSAAVQKPTVGRKRRIADVEAGSKCDVVAPKKKKRAVPKRKSATILGGNGPRKKAISGKRRGAAGGDGAVVHNVVEGGQEGAVCHAQDLNVWAVQVLPENPETEFWPHESFMWTWSECENVQFNA